jgi:hypothetical protein
MFLTGVQKKTRPKDRIFLCDLKPYKDSRRIKALLDAI